MNCLRCRSELCGLLLSLQSRLRKHTFVKAIESPKIPCTHTLDGMGSYIDKLGTYYIRYKYIDPLGSSMQHVPFSLTKHTDYAGHVEGTANTCLHVKVRHNYARQAKGYASLLQYQLMSICLYAYICIYIYIHIYVYMCMCIYIYIYYIMYVCTYVQM